MGKKIKLAVFVLVGLFAVAQLIQPNRTNPSSDPAVSFETLAKPPAPAKDIIERSCMDCHSNQTVWPWYSRVAPASWLVAHDVSEAREVLNFSEWGRMSQGKQLQALRNMCEDVKDGDMPPFQYKLIHRAAALQPDEVTALCQFTSQTR